MSDLLKNRRPVSPFFGVLLVVAIILASLNLRPAVTSLGAMLDPVIADLEMNGFIAGVITGVPPLCFAIFGIFTSRLAGKFGPEMTIIAAMGAILTGILLRSIAPGTMVFLLCTALALGGIALANILMPVMVKRWFPHKVGLVTSAYTTALALGASAVAGVAVPVNDAMGGNWRLGLAVWATPALLAVIAWVIIYVGMRPQIADLQAEYSKASSTSTSIGPMYKNSTAWWVAMFFGAQASVAYIFMGWAPKIFSDQGVDPVQSGVLLAVLLGVGVPLSFIMPTLAARFKNQAPLVIVNGVVGLIAVAGMLWLPVEGAYLWAVLLGICGSNFPLALTMIGLKSRSAAGVAKLSGFGQSVGYLIAFPGPFAVGAVHEMTGTWNASMLLIGALIVFQTITGIMAGRPRYIEDAQRTEVR